ncbi:MAG TPA: asparagine synthase-related protein, partial [Verrucomicrobiae bacterium]|nr:asparagine synthase-related protein [Verrucomicrobiae bacterium]
QCLGADLKVRLGEQKWLHRRVCEKFLPGKILRRKKRGFAVNVVDDWFQSSFNGRVIDSLLDDQSLMFGQLKPEPVRTLLREHQARRQDNHKLLFSLVMFEQWLRGLHANLDAGEPAVAV